jgi:hypothetical protein
MVADIGPKSCDASGMIEVHRMFRAGFGEGRTSSPRCATATPRTRIPLQQAYAESWSPGKFEWVDSGHDIHVEKPEAVADAVRWVVEHRSG